ncbi:MAG: RIP metalloprotease RseP [Acidobacteriota bacterium]|nr:RIP metalloprotease RseP [Acidobacteriota bacterium]MDE3171356.1 RIP metalloprotease RseP [Acidobacteriota bacterium]
MAANALRDIVVGAIVLGILVLIHEWGHFIMAKLCGVRVEVFSIGFGARLWGKKRGDTDYRISALPLGGYVKMAGDNPVEERSGEPYEFLSRPRWQRFLIAIAGPSMNILLTLVIFWGIYAIAGMPADEYLRQPAMVAAIPENPPTAMAIRPGDQIVQVGKVTTPTWGKVMAQIQKAKPGSSVPVTVLRNGASQTFEVSIPGKQTSLGDLLGYPLIPSVIDQAPPGFPAEKAGMKAGDKIVSMNGQPIVTFQQLMEKVPQVGSHSIEFGVLRDGKRISIHITPIYTMNGNGKMTWQIGVVPKSREFFERQGIVESAKDSVLQSWYLMKMMGDVLSGLVHGRVSARDLMGPVGIVQMSGEAAQGGFTTLLSWMAYISLDLGLLNLLPIPILDGGHVLMLAVEGSLRRDLSVAVKERFVQVGLVFLLCLVALAFYSDIHRLIGY